MNNSTTIQGDGKVAYIPVVVNSKQTMMEKILYTYGMRLRGYSIGCQPIDGFVAADDDVLQEYHNILYYDRKLSDEDCKNYDLDYLGKRRLRT